jgi:ribose transport system substrate-binding protein
MMPRSVRSPSITPENLHIKKAVRHMKRYSRWTAASIVAATFAVTAVAGNAIGADDTATPPSSSASETTGAASGDAECVATSAPGSAPSDTATVATDGGGESGEPLEIAVLSPDYAAQPASKEAIDLFQAAAEANGHTVTVVDTNSDNAAMNAEITTAVSQGVDAIVVAFGTPQEFGDGLADAVEAGIPVFGLDTGGVVDGILVNVTTDNAFLGEQSAQAIIDEIGEGGTVAMIHFDPFEPVRLRAEAARALFEENGIEIVEYIQGDPEDSTGFASAAVGDLLAKYPEGELDAIWAGWDASALGAYQATVAADRTEILVTGVDGQAFAIAEVATGGNWIATVKQDWAEIAATELDLIEAYFAGDEPAETVVYVPAVVITAENACV